ncbi:MAG TPA: alpha/beta hydrolase [Mycobacteriales bacterium]|jgi:pimeloyl-ACP methyl ester carboxylesterase|nr:alpha/beta hydrolase [Mycobacteriales bacterium]
MTTFASYDGTRLSYEQVGQGPPLLCLPGGPGRAAAYLEDLGGLAQSRTLVLLDLRATGRSEVPADPASLRFHRMADDVEALREHLQLPTADLLGHSAGCLVAQAWAAAHPDRVGRLLLVTPTDRLQGGTRDDVPGIRAGRVGEPWYADAAEAQEALAYAPPSQAQQLVRATRPFFYGRWDERTQAHAASADRQSSRRAEIGFRAEDGEVDVDALLASLGRLPAPVLVVGGERDALTGVAAVHRVAATFPSAAVAVVPAAGHFPWVDEPEAFRAVVEPFLS